MLFVDGVHQSTDKFTITSAPSATLNFNSGNAPATGSEVACVIIQDSFSFANVNDGAITAAKLNAAVISGHTNIGAAPAETDELLISDAGVLKAITVDKLLDPAGYTNIGAEPAGSDELLISDAGVLKAVTVTNLIAGAGGGAWVQVVKGTASDDASLTLDPNTTSYDAFLVVGQAVLPATDRTELHMRLGDSGGVSTTSSYYYHNAQRASGTTSYGASTGNAGTSFLVGQDIGNGSEEGLIFHAYIAQETSKNHKVWWQSAYRKGGAGSDAESCHGGGYWNNTSQIRNIQFYFDSGNITSGTFVCYGLSVT